MKISKRLKTICELVDPGSEVIDVGCDHGLAGIYLTLEKHCQVVCTDINAQALENAKNNIRKHHLEMEIKTVVTDGLEEIDTSRKTILICGMGTNTVMHIINHVVERDMRDIIVQSNNDWDVLREYMMEQGFYIADERYIVERDKHYVIIKFKVGNIPYYPEDILLGPVLKTTSRDCLQYLYDQRVKLLKEIPLKYFGMRKKIKQEKNIISIALKKIKM